MAPDDEVGRLPAVFLVWKDLTVTVRNTRGGSRKLLQGISGCALPGRLLAIMGPSGSGKSTLLDSLAGRLGRNVGLSGTLLLNGQKTRTDYGVAAYVRQENVLLGTLTVRETLTYSAHLRLPSSMTKKEVMGVVEATIEEMGLEDCSDRVVGNWHRRGISGGQKKRLCIALEILTKPPLLFLDEPTSGLDSAAAFFIIEMLRQMTRDGNKTVISSIHQPSSETIALFDDLFLLSGGEVVYFGDVKLATKFFAEAGLPCPIKRSPADHFLRCINSDFDRVNAALQGSIKHLSEPESSLDPLVRLGTVEIKAMLIDTFKSSEYALMTKTNISELSNIGILMMTAGFFRPTRDLPKPVWRYPITYISYYSWLLQGIYKNDFIGSSFNPMVAGDSNVAGEFVLEDTFGVTLRHSKWVDLLVAALILITYRILFYLILVIDL